MVEPRRIAVCLLLLSLGGVLPGLTEARAAPVEAQEPATPSDALPPPPLVPAEPSPTPDADDASAEPSDPDSAPYRSDSRRPSSPTLLVPTAGTTPHGGFVGGLSGRF